MHWTLTEMQSGYLNQKRMNRNTFITLLVRGGFLTVLAFIAGIMVKRNQVTLERECGLDLQCRNCSKLAGCRLPEAEKARENEKG